MLYVDWNFVSKHPIDYWWLHAKQLQAITWTTDGLLLQYHIASMDHELKPYLHLNSAWYHCNLIIYF